jgi:hypothetical protein
VELSGNGMRCQNVADVSSIRTNSAHGGGLLRRPNRVVAAIDGESKRCAEMPYASGLIADYFEATTS